MFWWNKSSKEEFSQHEILLWNRTKAALTERKTGGRLNCVRTSRCPYTTYNIIWIRCGASAVSTQKQEMLESDHPCHFISVLYAQGLKMSLFLAIKTNKNLTAKFCFHHHFYNLLLISSPANFRCLTEWILINMCWLLRSQLHAKTWNVFH